MSGDGDFLVTSGLHFGDNGKAQTGARRRFHAMLDAFSKPAITAAAMSGIEGRGDDTSEDADAWGVITHRDIGITTNRERCWFVRALAVSGGTAINLLSQHFIAGCDPRALQ